MAHLLKSVAQDLPHPTDEGRTLWDARNDQGPFTGQNDSESGARSAVVDEGLGIHPLGSGSDYTAFLQRLGVCNFNAV
ncbi:MAG TPA: hypothetical protein VGO47_02460, partial [Chlamydiales bacterium]|nr:hypothetical protein [Chlamydiales bacterium]